MHKDGFLADLRSRQWPKQNAIKSERILVRVLAWLSFLTPNTTILPKKPNLLGFEEAITLEIEGFTCNVATRIKIDHLKESNLPCFCCLLYHPFLLRMWNVWAHDPSSHSACDTVRKEVDGKQRMLFQVERWVTPCFAVTFRGVWFLLLARPSRLQC